LSFRLAANMRAGHILLGLIGIAASSAIFSSPLSFSLLFLIQLGYIIFEIGICLIQAYIFCLLLSLYSEDHPSN
jgi:F-type H+-transporting ATPase subunit a